MEQEHCNGRTTWFQTSLRNTDTSVTIDFSQQHRTKNILLPHKNISILIFPPYSLLTSASGGESDNILESWDTENGWKVAKISMKKWKIYETLLKKEESSLYSAFFLETRNRESFNCLCPQSSDFLLGNKRAYFNFFVHLFIQCSIKLKI